MPTAAKRCVIECQKSGLTLHWQPGSPPVLDLLEKAGGRPAYSCRYGNCHTCVATIVSGEVAHPPDVSSPGAGKMLSCCAAPISEHLVLEL